jgi:hypothetical protein
LGLLAGGQTREIHIENQEALTGSIVLNGSTFT